MDKLTAIKIKYNDGTYSDEIPVSVLAENVRWSNNNNLNLTEVLGNVKTTTAGTVQDQIDALINEKADVSDVTSLGTRVTNVEIKIGGIANGTPPTADSTDDMNHEVSTVYINTTDGNWYYWDGSAWISGGVYGGAVTSTTFNQHGVPADDFAVGEALADKADADDVESLTDDISDLNEDLTQLDADLFDLTKATGNGYNYNKTAYYVSSSGWDLNAETGLCYSDANYKLMKYNNLVAGSYIYIKSDHKFQFQSSVSVPSTGTPNRIGKTLGVFEGLVKVPEGATYGVFGTPVSNSDIYLLKINETFIESLFNQYRDSVGYFKKDFTVPANMPHSSMDDRLRVDLKQGDKVLIWAQVNGVDFGAEFFGYDDGEKTTTLGVFLKPHFLSVAEDYKYIGVYIGSNTSSRFVSITAIKINSIAFESLTKYSNLTLESGSYMDADGISQTSNANRIRTRVPVSVDDIQTLVAPTGYLMYIFLFDKDIQLIDNISWTSAFSTNGISNEVKYVNIVFKSIDNAAISSNIDDVYAALKNKDNLDNDDYKFASFKTAYYPYTIRNNGSAWKNRINVMHISDCHITGTGSKKCLIEAIDLVNSMSIDSRIDALMITGDHTNGKQKEKTAFLAELDLFVEEATKSVKPALPCLGNHDANDGFSDSTSISNIPTSDELWNHGFAPFAEAYPSIVWGGTKKRYGYVDITNGDHTIRFITLDMVDHEDYTTTSVYKCQQTAVYSQDQIDWLAETALNVEDGYGVVICNHFPFAPSRASGYSEEYATLNDAVYAQGWKMIPEIVQAWQERTTISKTYQDNKGTQNIVVDYDFSEIGTDAIFVCYLTGHTHSKNVYQVEQENGDSFDQLMLCEDATGAPGVALSKVYKFIGTIVDSALSCLSFDLDEKKIYRTSYGAYKKFNDPTVTQVQVFDILEP